MYNVDVVTSENGQNYKNINIFSSDTVGCCRNVSFAPKSIIKHIKVYSTKPPGRALQGNVRLFCSDNDFEINCNVVLVFVFN